MELEKWMYRKHMYPRIYNRHPDTGDRMFRSSYITTFGHTKQTLIEEFSKHGWIFLREDGHRLVFYKEI